MRQGWREWRDGGEGGDGERMRSYNHKGKYVMDNDVAHGMVVCEAADQACSNQVYKMHKMHHMILT